MFLPFSRAVTETDPDPPTELTAIEITSTSFNITWKKSQEDTGKGNTVYYIINVMDMKEKTVVHQIKVDSSILEFRVPKLDPDRVYQVSVTAVLGERTSPSVALFVKTSQGMCMHNDTMQDISYMYRYA